jgi:hypothetical protein
VRPTTARPTSSSSASTPNLRAANGLFTTRDRPAAAAAIDPILQEIINRYNEGKISAVLEIVRINPRHLTCHDIYKVKDRYNLAYQLNASPMAYDATLAHHLVQSICKPDELLMMINILLSSFIQQSQPHGPKPFLYEWLCSLISTMSNMLLQTPGLRRGPQAAPLIHHYYQFAQGFLALCSANHKLNDFLFTITSKNPETKYLMFMLKDYLLPVLARLEGKDVVACRLVDIYRYAYTQHKRITGHHAILRYDLFDNVLLQDPLIGTDIKTKLHDILAIHHYCQSRLKTSANYEFNFLVKQFNFIAEINIHDYQSSAEQRALIAFMRSIIQSHIDATKLSRLFADNQHNRSRHSLYKEKPLFMYLLANELKKAGFNPSRVMTFLSKEELEGILSLALHHYQDLLQQAHVPAARPTLPSAAAEQDVPPAAKPSLHIFTPFGFFESEFPPLTPATADASSDTLASNTLSTAQWQAVHLLLSQPMQDGIPSPEHLAALTLLVTSKVFYHLMLDYPELNTQYLSSPMLKQFIEYLDQLPVRTEDKTHTSHKRKSPDANLKTTETDHNRDDDRKDMPLPKRQRQNP